MNPTPSRPPEGLPTLIVLAGRPGTGKTTLAKALVPRLQACYLRVDAVETALQRNGRPVGVEAYAVTHELALSNLLLGRDVVVDAVNPVPEARGGWRETALRGRVRLLQVETWLCDRSEHRRRVEARTPDVADQRVPSWLEVENQVWVPWESERDGPRTLIETSDSDEALAALLALHASV